MLVNFTKIVGEKVVEERSINVRACPTLILVADHYRADGTCRHDEIICEENACNSPKFEDEIYCKFHVGDY